MISNGKPTRNADLRHAQSIGRQRQAAQRAAASISTEDLTHILPQDELPKLPDAAPVTTLADAALADAARPSWRDHEPAIVHSIKWVDANKHEHLHIVRGDTLDEVLLHLRAVKAVIAAARTRDAHPVAEELPQGHELPMSDEQAPYCHEHDTRFFRNVWRNGRVSWSHRKAGGSGFCRYKG
jgi:hypothetical protein